jgi:glutamate/tyrosine decarboxylase-like PLP-dependent enzyme
VRDPRHLVDAFSFHPVYYHFADGDGGETPVNFHELGLQNSRGFRALKVWLTLRQVGRDGYRRMIADDIALARALFDAAAGHPELRAVTCGLSITTFAYVPEELRAAYEAGDAAATAEVDALNAEILARTQEEGKLYLSNAVVDGRFLLRACIVNFRTGLDDVLAVPGLVADVGRRIRGAALPAP